MSNSNETADDAVNDVKEASATPENSQELSELKSTESVGEGAKVPVKKKSAKKVVRVTAKKAAKSADPEGDTTEGKDTAKGARKEPIQGVRDRRTKKDDSDESSPELDLQKEDKATVLKKDKNDSPREPEAKGAQAENSDEQVGDDPSQGGNNRNRRGRRGRKPNEQGSQSPKRELSPIDHKELNKKAWKVFLGEVNEEGLALIGDKEARELAKRSFRLAEIFLEEDSRKKPVKAKKVVKAKKAINRNNDSDATETTKD